MTPSIVFDFDGTLALGHGPVLAFARAVAPAAAPGYLERVTAEIAAYDAGTSSHRDGYGIVGALAREDGVTEADVQAAYTASRAVLGTADALVDTMPELAAFLTEIGTTARLVLATNAPETGIATILESWGATGLFHEEHFNVGKPAGLEGLVARLLKDGPVLAIGDIAVNDLLPALEQGAATALVGATAQTDPRTYTMRAATLHDLRSDITTWVATAVAPNHTISA